ncbi:MAG: aminotransferase class I/II-fold pyridoxal phosphate-dependent enzyme [Candidatus Thermoplasmatota archaeon]|nr:aminotransferase class I/II-fold pyridoxal phosphate-dependent enzyme [Candidatus Thermoplasmatota archaeon]
MADEHADKRFATRSVHSGTQHIEGAVNTPIFQSSTYYLTDERYAGWADGAQHTLIYSRLSSVNSEACVEKICALEGAEDGELFASGMAAISTVLMGLLSNGDHVVANPDIYGGTYGLMTQELPRFGIDVSMADMRDPQSYEAAIQDNTKMLYIESLSNPVLKVCDIEAMAAIARAHDLLLVIDNTFTTPWGCQPIEMGCDLVLHSTTKYLGGHSDTVGGAVVGRKDLIAELFPKKVHFGGSPDPHACYLLERGMRTLSARMPIHCANAAEIAKRLEAHPKITSVIHPSLASHPDYEVGQRIMPKGTGMLAFVINGGDDAASRFMRGLKLFFEATSLGGVESLIECPFNTSHMSVPEDVRMAAGVVPGFVRVSIGIEDVEDLWEDIARSLEST